jgi:hypothetical protein
MKIPKKCNDCKCIEHYKYGPFARNPHSCCELMWHLFELDYRVNPDYRDAHCPFNNQKFMEGYEEVLKDLNIEEDEDE